MRVAIGSNISAIRRVLDAVQLDPGLRAETNSARRADALRATLESHLQGLVLRRLRKEENTAN